MQLIIDSLDPSRVVLKARELYKIAVILLKGFGITFILCAILLIAIEPFGTAGHVIAGLGFFLWGISHAIRRQAEYLPSRLEFENATGYLRI